MKDILEQIHYGVTFAVLMSFIIAVLAIIIMRGAYQCLRPSK